MSERNNGIAAGLVLMVAVGLAIGATVERCGRADAKGPQWHHSLASQFGSKTIGDPVSRGTTYDKQQGYRFFCTGQKTDPMAWGVAHRTLPCGTVFEICKGKLCVFAEKVTTGPFHAVPMTCGPKWSQKCWRLGKTIAKRRLANRAWRFAGDLDLLPRVAWAIRLGGKGIVKWRVVHIPKRRVLRRITR